eukprot:785343-Pelagomonas_calceolata.AAC.1
MQWYGAQDVEPVCTAIRNSPLKLQPRVEGREVQVPIPRWVYNAQWVCFSYLFWKLLAYLPVTTDPVG